MASNVDIATFKEYIGTELSKNDSNLLLTLDAAESAVFRWCRRRIVVPAPGAVATSRLFVPLTPWLVETDDFTTLTSVTDGTTPVLGPDYQLEPLNNLAENRSGEYRPYSAIRHVNANWSGEWDSWSRPLGKATVTVAAVWGWAAVPDAVKLATLMVGKDMRSAKDIAFGVQFTDYAGIRIRENPMVVALLQDYRKDPVMTG